ncbi:hypothetical protein GH714_033550 [Hevea brasiliensis]|uniref:Legume lectin domain-containing protein n=1 Tax=Hevea brasiliensis TaxID=3981 RepID=A0A6A6KKF8_HEVBR|nr:hypothetical protein GH714_033550 [Hevea brasiliensis]
MSFLVISADGGLSETGQVFYNHPFKFRNSSPGSVFFFSTTFIVAVVSKDPKFNGHGLAFAISLSKGIPGASPNQYLGLFNASNNGNSANHVVAVELETDQDFQFHDTDDNQLAIDINGLLSVEYESLNHQLNVTIHSIKIPKPMLPLLSLTKDNVGFSSASGSTSSHYILGWSFKMNDQATEIDQSTLPDIPGYTDPKIVQSGKSTTCTDIYAFGVFALEVICGSKPVDRRVLPEKVMLIDWLGLLCSHPVAAARPSISSVVEFLTGAAQLPENLSSIIKSRDSDDSSGQDAANEKLPSEKISIASLTFTESFVSYGH